MPTDHPFLFSLHNPQAVRSVYLCLTSVLTLAFSANSSTAGRLEARSLAPFTDRTLAYEYFSNPWTLIGLKDYPNGTRILPSLGMNLAEQCQLRFFAGSDGLRIPGSLKRTLHDGYLPIVKLHFRDANGVTYLWWLFATPLRPYDHFDRPSGDGNYLNHVMVQLTNEGKTPRMAQIGLDVIHDSRWTFKEPPRPETLNLLCSAGKPATGYWRDPILVTPSAFADSLARDARYVVTNAGRLVLTISGSARVFRRDGRLWIRESLLPNATACISIQVPYQQLSPTTYDDTETLFPSRPDAVIAWWKCFLDSHPTLHIPEPKVQECYRTGLVQQFITRDEGVIKPGEGFYDRVYLRDAAYQIYALGLMGYLKEARASLDHCLQWQREDGRFESQLGQLDANGHMLWAVREHFLLTRDRRWLQEVFPRVNRSVEWIIRTRKIRDGNHPFAGLLPAAPADGEDLWDGDCHIVGYDLWNLRGMLCAAECARAAGRDSLARCWTAEADRYRERILQRLQQLNHFALPPSYEGRGTHWGNLEIIFPFPVLPLHAPRVEATLAGVEATYREGVMPWGNRKVRAVHPYATTFVQLSRAMQGEYRKTIDGFYAQLLHTSAAHAFAEGIYDDRRFAWRSTLPHQWGSAMFLIYLRYLLLQEREARLVLLPAVPDHWLGEGKSVGWRNLPTRFGPTSLNVSRRGDMLYVRYSVPREASLREVILRLPPGVSMRPGTSSSSRDFRMLDFHSVALRRGTGEFSVAVQASPQPLTLSFSERARGFLKVTGNNHCSASASRRHD